MQTIAIFGGTFDPVHNGHIQTNLTIQKHFKFDSYRFIPCKIPAIKPPAIANAEQRIAMLKLALHAYKEFTLDLREINRDTPSYMIETLESIRQEQKESSITLVVGYDAFLSFPKWYQWERILNLANVLVINRDTFNTNALSQQLQKILSLHEVQDTNQLLEKQSGAIYAFDAGAYPISSTEIRSALKNKLYVHDQLPQSVHQYIRQQGLYQ